MDNKYNTALNQFIPVASQLHFASYQADMTQSVWGY
jgi:hypothetical protein